MTKFSLWLLYSWKINKCRGKNTKKNILGAPTTVIALRMITLLGAIEKTEYQCWCNKNNFYNKFLKIHFTLLYTLLSRGVDRPGFNTIKKTIGVFKKKLLLYLFNFIFKFEFEFFINYFCF